jgi:hypothetical protein
MKFRAAANLGLVREYKIMKQRNHLEDKRKKGPATCAQ